MITFEVNDMTCKHCIATITQAVAEIDAQAVVHVDLATHRVDIESSTASVQAVSQSIKNAGYSPTVASSNTVVSTAKKTGCCCG